MLNTMRRAGLVISLAGFAISVNTVPALVPWFSNQFMVPVGNFGILFLLQFAAFTLCSMGVGKLHASRKLPLLAIAVVSLIISSVLLFLIGLLPNFFMLVLVMIVIGGAGGLVESIGTTLITTSNGSNRMLYTSQFFYALGAFFAPLLVGLLLRVELSVPRIGNMVGLFTFCIAIAVWLLIFQPWKRRVVPTMMKPGGDGDNSIPDSQIIPESTDMVVAPSGVRYAFPFLFLTMVSYVMIEGAVGSWFAVYVYEALSASESQSSFALSMFWVGLGVSRLISMFRVYANHPRTLLTHMAMMGASVVILIFLPLGEVGFLLFIAIFLLGFGCGPVWPLLIEYCSKIFVTEHLLMYLVGGGSLGALLGPVVTSTLFSIIGVDRMMYLYLAYVMLMIGMTVVMLVVTASHRNRGRSPV